MNRELYVAEGIIKYADALMRAHHVDRALCWNHLLSLVHEQYKIDVYDQTKTK